jgi:serine protease inhibitor
MKAKIFLLIAVVSSWMVISCKKDSSADPVKTVVSLTPAQKSVFTSSNKFGLTLFKNLASEVPADSNLFISPLSVSLALTMTCNGAASQTETSIQTTLGFAGMSKSEINQACKDLVRILENCDPNVSMGIANSIWYRNTFTVRDSFLTINQNYFNAEVKAADFDNPQTVTLINNWVNAKTNGKINSIITAPVPSNLVMYLINAIYFKGFWKYAFDQTNTSKADFTLSDGTVYSTDFMVQKDTISYYENDLFTSVALPYGNGNFSMVVLVPKEGKNYRSILDNLDESSWNSWNAGLQNVTNVQVYLPKFTFGYGSKLNDVLSSMGMSVAFDPNNADFSGIDGAHDLFISEVKHKAWVEVNEKGTEAAAVTSVSVIATTVGPGEGPIDFRANKPFIFAIKENTTNNILFIGLMQKPVIM